MSALHAFQLFIHINRFNALIISRFAIVENHYSTEQCATLCHNIAIVANHKVGLFVCLDERIEGGCEFHQFVFVVDGDGNGSRIVAAKNVDGVRFAFLVMIRIVEEWDFGQWVALSDIITVSNNFLRGKYLVFRLFGKRNADSIANAIVQERTYTGGRFDASVVALARLGNAKMQAIIHLFVLHRLHHQTRRTYCNGWVGRFQRNRHIIEILCLGNPQKFHH